jgi:cobalt/nickel transport system permease protein
VRRGAGTRGAVERTVDGLLRVMDRAVEAEAGAARAGLLQAVDPRVKVAGLLSLVAAVALSHRLEVIAALLVLGLALSALSQMRLLALVSGAWLVAVSLSLALALPALFLTPGPAIAELPLIGWKVTSTGLTSAAFLVLRVSAAATFGFLLVFTTPWPRVLRALRAFAVPVVMVAVLGMTYRYILLLLEGAHDMFVARRSRAVGRLTDGERRRLAGQHAGVLLGRSLQLGGEVYLAMQARGFRGEVLLVEDLAMTPADWLALAAFAAVAAFAIWAGR